MVTPEAKLPVVTQAPRTGAQTPEAIVAASVKKHEIQSLNHGYWSVDIKPAVMDSDVLAAMRSAGLVEGNTKRTAGMEGTTFTSQSEHGLSATLLYYDGTGGEIPRIVGVPMPESAFGSSNNNENEYRYAFNQGMIYAYLKVVCAALDAAQEKNLIALVRDLGAPKS